MMARLMLFVVAMAWSGGARAEEWPRWRGPEGNAVSDQAPLPVRWSTQQNVRWSARISGEGSSSPIVWKDRLFLTSALDDGTRRVIHCLKHSTGKTLWSRELEDNFPEISSTLTGHAAATPVTDGQHVVAFFGNAGVVCYDYTGKRLWKRRFDYFDSELGLASSPILYRDRVILVCDHDGSRLKSFDSFLIALDIRNGKTVWKTDRPGLFRSWSTPILVPIERKRPELLINAQDQLRAYNPETGKQLWFVTGMTGWVTPSPVFGQGLVFATSGKDGPTMAVRPGGRGDVTHQNVVWLHKRGAPYVCSPLLYQGRLYVHNEQGILTCFAATSGRILYRKRLEGKFIASGVAGDGKLYLTNDAGMTFVIKTGDEFHLLAKNSLQEECLASPVISGGQLLMRTQFHVYCIGRPSKS